MARDGLPEGLYESLVTRLLSERLATASELDVMVEPLGEIAALAAVSRHLGAVIDDALLKSAPEHRIELANRLLAELSAGDAIDHGPLQLLSVHRPGAFKRRDLRRPSTALSDSALLTNGRDEPNLAAELRAEMESANTVDLLCAFIR